MHDGDVNSKSSEVHFDDGQIVSGSTLQVRFNDALYLMARDLSALMKVSTTINAIRGVEELQKTFARVAFRSSARGARRNPPHRPRAPGRRKGVCFSFWIRPAARTG